MGFVQAVRCDGCGIQGDYEREAGVVTIPEGWRVRNIGSDPTVLEPRGLQVITVCPECWPVKTLAEVLGS